MKRHFYLFALVLGLAVIAHAKRSKPHPFKPSLNGTKHSINEVDTNDEEGQAALNSLANEFVHSLHEAIYLVNQAVQNAQDNPEFQKILKEVSNDATDLAFAIQKEIHGDARQLGFQIKSSIIFLTVLLPEITKITETYENSTFSSSLLREAVDSTIFAVQDLEVRSELTKKTNEELAVIAVKTFGKLFEIIKETNSEDHEIAVELHIQLHHLNHILDKTVNQLEVWLHANTVENENSKVVEEAAQHLGKITADLRKGISATLTVSQLKEKLESTIKAAHEQIKKLGQIEVNANQANQEHAKDVYRNTLYSAIAIGRTFVIKLEYIIKAIKAQT